MAPVKSNRHSYRKIQDLLEQILLKHGFTGRRAELCARLFAETSLDGIYSHGLNRFPLFIENVRKGVIRPDKEPSLLRSVHHFEKWDGNLGPGNLNAWFCMDRAVNLARDHGTGIVSLRNTNHWLRGGTYGLQAASRNCIGICATNTKPNMPPWGGRKVTIGNNPFILAVPYDPYPVLLDMAMSQFSYGKMELYSQQGKQFPYPAGFNKNFALTRDPDEILASELALPMGYWKGSGLAVMIDMLVAVLSGGLATRDIGELEEETALSQLFLAMDLEHLSGPESSRGVIQKIIDSVTGCDPVVPGDQVHYPGHQTWLRRMENEKEGIPVPEDLWEKINRLAM